ncbi:hypothetical protein KM043_005704 [Ampulex compressa]|nr:hypothetical protein KM043_005704 [Ampulex compressa]
MKSCAGVDRRARACSKSAPWSWPSSACSKKPALRSSRSLPRQARSKPMSMPDSSMSLCLAPVTGGARLTAGFQRQESAAASWCHRDDATGEARSIADYPGFLLAAGPVLAAGGEPPGERNREREADVVHARTVTTWDNLGELGDVPVPAAISRAREHPAQRLALAVACAHAQRARASGGLWTRGSRSRGAMRATAPGRSFYLLLFTPAPTTTGDRISPMAIKAIHRYREMPRSAAIEAFGKDYHLPPEVSSRLNDYWHAYKAQFNKTYIGNIEASRRTAWERNLVTIYKHNLMAAAGHHSYTLRDNHMADLGTRQYIRDMVKLIPSRMRRVSREPMVSAVLHDPRSIPSHLDWRERGFITPPENQRDCGSCYAYSIAGSIQGQIFKKTGMLLPLSEQQLVDCSTTTGNLGCSGGSLRNTLRYLERAKGLMAQHLYPYKGEQGQCRFQEDLSVVNITSWAVLPARDEKALEAAVATIGPIAASLNASPKTFQLYHKGVYDDDRCSSDSVNHAVLIVGYTPREWILKNWWGSHWGENGYMRLAKNRNRCGVANYAAYARV